MWHKTNCMVNVDRECGLCSCGAEEEAARDAELTRLRAELTRAREALRMVLMGHSRAEVEACAAKPCNGSQFSMAVHALADGKGASGASTL